MRLKINLGIFGKITYLIALQLNQPFTLDELTLAVQTLHPTWTQKNIRIRLKSMLQQNLMSKHRIRLKTYYTCLINKEDFLSAETISVPNKFYTNNFFICGL